MYVDNIPETCAGRYGIQYVISVSFRLFCLLKNEGMENFQPPQSMIHLLDTIYYIKSNVLYCRPDKNNNNNNSTLGLMKKCHLRNAIL